MTDEGPYPSTVTGAVPFGAPVTVAWAAAGVATVTPSIAVADSADINKKHFIGISLRLDRAAPTLCFQTLFHRPDWFSLLAFVAGGAAEASDAASTWRRCCAALRNADMEGDGEARERRGSKRGASASPPRAFG
jgi:hypothetical protein